MKSRAVAAALTEKKLLSGGSGLLGFGTPGSSGDAIYITLEYF